MDGSLFPEPEDLSEWEQVELPFPHTVPAIHHSGASSELEGVGHNCIHHDSDNEDVVFPPTHHEGLQLPHPTLTNHQAPPDDHQYQPVNTLSHSPPSSSSLSAMSSEGDDEARDRQPWLASGMVAANEIWRRLRLRLGIMNARVLLMASKLSAGGNWAVASMTGVVAAVLVSLYARVLLRRLRPRVVYCHHDKERMVLLLREKDEMISQLLLRVAQMNEALTSRRRVPVLRIGPSTCL